MNPDVKALWLEALRRPDTEEGWYQQTTGRYHRTLKDGTDAFCVLGVLINLAAERSIAGVPGMPTAAEWADLDASDSCVLLDYNDYGGWSFAQIADWIEANL